MPFVNEIKDLFSFQFFYTTFGSGEEHFKGNAFLAHFGTLCALCALDEDVVHKICRH
jgi:hypothetical protein